jgi:hypothetical protein
LTKEDIVTVDTLWIVADRTILEGEEIQRLWRFLQWWNLFMLEMFIIITKSFFIL